MQEGNILDCYPDYQKNRVITWITNNGKAKKIKDFFKPSFYVYSSRSDLYDLSAMFYDTEEVEQLNFTYKKIKLGSETKKLVLEIKPKKIKDLTNLAEKINYLGKYHRYKLFNVDIRLPTRYLENKNIFCNAYTLYDNKIFFTDEKKWDIDYKKPRYRSIFLDVKRKNNKIKSFNDPISVVLLDNYIVAEENEIDTLISAVKAIDKIDPDIIYTKDGDSFLLPYIYYRAKKLGIEHLINLNRDKKINKKSSKKAKSYFSYGRILYRPAFNILHGRIHIDTDNSFLYNESSLFGLIDISRCSNIPLQILSRLGPGTAISQIQVNKVLEKNYLVPWKKNIPETWKNAIDLLVSDRGGLILEPKIGLHEDIIEIDFASLYPNIMLKYNVSPETMLCNCCKNSANIVPQIGYNICTKKPGLIPLVLEPIIKRRFCFKARSKNKNYDAEIYKEMQMAWKWILLVCFGYTGYKNARYGRIECHESITAYSRDILLDAIDIAEKSGYRVLHGIIDSLWLKPQKNCVKTINLLRNIGEKTGIKMDFEGRYKWIVFLPCKDIKIGALNRYYGLFENGKIKVRGIELRQRNTPIFLKKLQKEILFIFSKAKDKKEFLEEIPNIIDLIKKYGKKLVNHGFKKEDLIFKSRVSRNISDYKVNNFVKSALIQLEKMGISIEPGQNVRYIVLDEKEKDPLKRVCVLERIDECNFYDIDFYLRQIAKCSESILIPFNYRLEKIYSMLQKIKKREVNNVSILS